MHSTTYAVKVDARQGIRTKYGQFDCGVKIAVIWLVMPLLERHMTWN
jgi:hypothetical protein